MKTGRPPRGYAVHAFQVRLPEALHAALLRAMGASKRTKSAEIQIALEHYLHSIGHWDNATTRNNATGG